MDGADAGRFMNSLKRYLEDPALLLISMDDAD
jgi:pyruvate/2-oxoglutarate dehydrogenase complex dihydrolipoamide acyltransferase (E2) component